LLIVLLIYRILCSILYIVSFYFVCFFIPICQ